jgi:pyruvate/2-oxoglutarate dehydrogenase complex dihydrolipoamide dehydrogenase (E3) component
LAINCAVFTAVLRAGLHAQSALRAPLVRATAESGRTWDPLIDAEAARQLEIAPLDVWNKRLLDEVRPRVWQDPSPPDCYDLVVIGAGAGGLVSSKQAARRGARSCMISERLAGGDCLNVGCVPSKALLRAARAVREVRRAAEFGVVLSEPARVDFGAIMERLRRLRAQIAPVDSHVATVATGADVYQGRGRFTGPDTVEVNGQALRFRKAVVATGGRPRMPDIPGLEDVSYVTNEQLFNLETLPERMVVLGAGAVGLEMAQAFATFGSHVTLVGRSPTLLAEEPPAAGAALRAALERDGVTFVLGARVTRAEKGADGGAGRCALTLALADGTSSTLQCDTLLVASGRIPNTEDLGLEAAGIETSADGVLVNDLLATTNPNVYAVGDCVAGTPRLTHMAGEMAKLAVQNSLFGGTWRLSSLVVPKCIYTEPELASVARIGPSSSSSSAAADLASAEVVVEEEQFVASLAGNDRAILEGESDDGGFVMVRCERGSGRVVGGTVLAPRAGEIVNEISLAVKANLTMESLGRNIHAYPTTGEATMACGLQWVNARWKTMQKSS